MAHKKGIIVSLTDKVFHVSHPQFHEKNLHIIIGILIENSYPLSLIFKVIGNRIHKLIFSTPNPVNSLPSSTSPCLSTSDPPPLLLCDPLY